jgi:hypothetical protein
MDKIYRILFIAVCAVGILFGLQYFLPVTAQYFNVEGVAGIPGLPSMPTFAYQATIEPLPLVTFEAPTQTGLLSLSTVTAFPAGTVTATTTITPTPPPGATSIPATATRSSAGGSSPPRTATRIPTRQSSPVAPTATPVPTSIPTATQAVVLNPCDNVLYPVRTGSAWQYRITAQGRSLNVNMVVATVSGQSGLVDVYNESTGAVSRAIVECDNGVIRSFPFIQGAMFSNLGTINVKYVSGVLAPSLAAFINNNWGLSWQGKYTLSGVAEAVFRGQAFELTLDNAPVTLTCQTTGTGDAAFETVSVVAGTAEALKVICTAQGQVTGTVNGLPVSGTITGRSTQWFADVGMVKLQVDSANFNIFGFDLPLELDGQIELLDFFVAP